MTPDKVKAVCEHEKNYLPFYLMFGQVSLRFPFHTLDCLRQHHELQERGWSQDGNRIVDRLRRLLRELQRNRSSQVDERGRQDHRRIPISLAVLGRTKSGLF